MLSLVPELVSKCGAKHLLTHYRSLVAKCNLFSIFKDKVTSCHRHWKREKLRASDLLGIFKKTNRHPPISIATKKSVRWGVRIWENLYLLAVTLKDSVVKAGWRPHRSEAWKLQPNKNTFLASLLIAFWRIKVQNEFVWVMNCAIAQEFLSGITQCGSIDYYAWWRLYNH